MSKLALFLSIAALGLAGYSAWSSREAPCAMRAMRAELDVVAGLETRVAALEAARAKDPLLAPPELARADSPAASPRVAHAGEAESPALAKVSSELERRIAALEEKSRADAQDLVPARGGRLGRLPRLPGGGSLYGSIEDAKEDLDLTDQQKGDFDRILADARGELEELRKIPNDEGKTYEQVMKEMMSGIREGTLKFDFSKMMSFRASTIPGRGETFGQAETRIKSAAKSRMRDTLTRDQQSKFDQAQVDPMLGPGFGATIVTTQGLDDVKPSGG